MLREKFRQAKNYIYHKEIFDSAQNTKITFKKFFGEDTITAGGCFQTSSYVNNLWRKMLRRVPREQSVKKVLLLGLGAGGCLKYIWRRFPKCAITCIEHDPVMVEIAKQTYLKNLPLPKIILADAGKAVSELNEKFDLIMYDLFTGQQTSNLLGDDKFMKNLQRLLAKDGWSLVNFYQQKAVFAPLVDRFFSRSRDLRYSYNKMAVYRHFGQGKAGEPLPENYFDKEQSAQYLKSTFYTPSKPTFTVTPKEAIIKFKFCKITFEKHIGDLEPKVEPCDGLRLITWQPLSRTQKVRGWWRLLAGNARFQSGISILNQDPNYYQTWSKHALRHRRHWLKETNFTIEKIDFKEFQTAYHESKFMDPLTRKAFIRTLNYTRSRNPECLHIFGVREIDSKKILAALAVTDYPDISQSIHCISFINKKIKHTSAGFGLIDHWYQHCLEHKINFLNFGIVWKKGDPRSWQGYSKFKCQFNLHLIKYPKRLIKFTCH